MDIGDGGETKGWIKCWIAGKSSLEQPGDITACIQLLLVKGNCVILRNKRGAAISTPLVSKLLIFRFFWNDGNFCSYIIVVFYVIYNILFITRLQIILCILLFFIILYLNFFSHFFYSHMIF